MNDHFPLKETTDPYQILSDFFDFATVEEARACLGGLLLAALEAQDGEELNYLHLYRKLERLVAAGWQLHQHHRSGDVVVG